MRRLILSLFACLYLATPALSEADGPDAWRVIGVAADDMLNVRVGPGTQYFIIGALPHNARGLQITTCVPTVTRDQFFALSEAQQARLNAYPAWCVVTWGGLQYGWVNRRYLGEDS